MVMPNQKPLQRRRKSAKRETRVYVSCLWKMLCRWHPVLERTLTIQPHNWTDDMHNSFRAARHTHPARDQKNRGTL